MESERNESDAWCQWSPNRLPRDTRNWLRRSRSRSIGSCGLKHGSEMLHSKGRRRIDHSASHSKDSVMEKYSRRSEQRFIHMKHEREEREPLRECKRGRYSSCDGEDLRDLLERKRCSQDGVFQRRVIDSSCDDLFKGRYKRDLARKYELDDIYSDGERFIRDNIRKMIYCKRDSDTSLNAAAPCRYIGEDRCQQDEDYIVTRHGMPGDSSEHRSCDRIQGYNVKHGNISSNDSRWEHRTSNRDANRPSMWKPDNGKRGYHMENGSWNGPKWGEKTTPEDASSRSYVTKKNSVWSRPKWGEEATSKDAPNLSKWPKWGEEAASMDAPNSSKWPKWGKEATSKNAPNTSKWPQWGEESTSKSAPNSSEWPKWGEEVISKNVPNSSKWPKWGEEATDNTKAEDSLPRTGRKWDDETNVKDGTSSRRPATTKCKPREEISNSCAQDGSKRNDEVTSKDERSSSQLRSDDNKWGTDVKNDNSLCWSGPKWYETETEGCSAATKLGSNVKSINSSSKNDEMRSKDAPKLSQFRSDVNRWSPNAATDNRDSDIQCGKRPSWTGPRWGDEKHVKNTSISGKPGCAKWGSNLEANNSSAQNGSKWIDQVKTKDAPGSPQLRSDNNKSGTDVKTDNSLCWSGPKGGDETETKGCSAATKLGSNVKSNNRSSKNDEMRSKDAPKLSQLRSDVSRWIPSAATDNQDSEIQCGKKPSWTGPRWGDEKHGKNTSISGKPGSAKWGSNLEANNSSAQNGSKLIDQAKTKVRSDTSKWGTNVQADNSLAWTGPNWGDTTTNEDTPSSLQRKESSDKQTLGWGTDNGSTWADPKWGDKTNVKSQLASGASRWGSSVKNGNRMSWTGPKWGYEENVRNASVSRISAANKWDSHVDNSCVQIVPMWNDDATTSAMPGSSQLRSDADKRGSNMKAGNGSLWTGSKWGDETTEHEPSAPWEKISNKKASNAGAGNGSSWTGSKWGDETTEHEPSALWEKISNKKASNAGADYGSSWNGSKWGAETTSKEANYSNWGADTTTKEVTSSPWESWGGQTTTKKRPNSCRWRSEDDGKWANYSNWGADTTTKEATSSPWESWRGQTTTKKRPDSCRWRSEDDGKLGYNMKNPKTSWNTPRQDYLGNTGKTKSLRGRFEGDQRDICVRRDSRCFSVENHYWPTQASKIEPSSSFQHKSDGDRKEYAVKPKKRSPGNGPNCQSFTKEPARSSHCRHDNITTKGAYDYSSKRSEYANCQSDVEPENSSLKGSNWGNETTTNDVSSLNSKCSADEQGLNVKAADSFSCKGPKWGEQTATEDKPKSSLSKSGDDKQDYVENEKEAYNKINWDGHGAIEEAPNPFSQRVDDDKQDYNVNSRSIVLLGATICVDKINTEVSPNFPRQSSDVRKNGCMKADNSLLQNDCMWDDQKTALDAPKSNHQKTTLDAPKSNQQRSDADRGFCVMETEDISLLHVPKGADKEIATDSFKSPKQRLDTDKQGHFLETVPKWVNTISTDSQDPTSRPLSDGQLAKSECQDHQLLQNSESMSQHSSTLDASADQASVDSATVPALLLPEACTLEYFQEKHSVAVEKSQVSKSSAPSFITSGATDDRRPKGSANLEENLHSAKQGSTKVKLIKDAVVEVNETDTGQSNKELYTSYLKMADYDFERVWETKKDDEKGIEMFKLEVMEFTKDLLRPPWKEGRLTREAHKIIVKKVVDKAVSTLPVFDIPRTHDHILLYISCNKTKLTDLVQAYLQIYAKS